MRRILFLAFLSALSLPIQAKTDPTPLEQIPIQEGGRKKPFLVFAEESLLSLAGKKSVPWNPSQLNAMEFITHIWLQPDGWQNWHIILLNNKPLKELLGLDTKRKLFSYSELVSNQKLKNLLAQATAIRNRPGNNRLTGLSKEAADVGLRLSLLEELASGDAFTLVPHPTNPDGAWAPLPPSDLQLLRTAWISGNSTTFSKAVRELSTKLSQISPDFYPPTWKIQLETLYQKSHPVRVAWILYLATAILLFAAFNSSLAWRIAWFLVSLGFLAQISGFIARMIISGRPPVTNMYESVIWVAFGTILFAILFQLISKSKIILPSALPVVIAALILADSLPQSLSRSITPLMPVLRDNFWLTTHVLTITISYAAFALALGISHWALGSIILGRKPSAAIYNSIYRCLQAGVTLLTTGTILGAVWANYSWGRFWDWDPKEVWALVALLSYLIVLHGRIAGNWGGFGLAVGSVLCFLTVLMAWYGVNFVLGIGLHSYGFGSGGVTYAALFSAIQLIFVAIAILRKMQLDRSTPLPHSATSTRLPTLTSS